MTEQRTWPADAVERRSVAALVPYARNARTHSDAQVAQIAASIREWGWTVPTLGHPAKRRLASKPMKEVRRGEKRPEDCRRHSGARRLACGRRPRWREHYMGNVT